MNKTIYSLLNRVKYSGALGWVEDRVLHNPRVLRAKVWQFQQLLMGKVKQCTCTRVNCHEGKCSAPAIGSIIGTGGEGPFPFCWPCAKQALDYEDGARGWYPFRR